jgi:hypothetical protein
MTASLTLACLWAIIASIVAMVPRRFHSPGAVALLAAGIPLPGWVTGQNGPLWGMPVLAGGAVLLRWPVVPFARRLWPGGAAREPAEQGLPPSPETQGAVPGLQPLHCAALSCDRPAKAPSKVLSNGRA